MPAIEVLVHGVYELGPEGFSCALIEWLSEGRVVPIWLTPADATMLDLRLRGIHSRRPTSHDLIAQLVEVQGGVSTIVIDSYHEGVFSATLSLSDGTSFDIRSSDALMLSAVTGHSVYVEHDVLQQCSLYLGVEDLKHYFGIDLGGEGEHGGGNVDHDHSASGDAQADADFQSLMQSMGVTESDLRGEAEGDHEGPETDVTGESDDEK
ncbi:bifunctional nuclease family protein [Corynebacterium poyangense]|uniref:Bifunctional nuclease family protein n=1 Tax=Corynebacterium poyangense TaxID=2684405 RepID=A0A7H0SNR5_9CORY|nr:bifunctional nuclease family protein [Corynebacterium poyangense]MBZ8177737.1 bifunctional nuclease family protein [Corynebacterium poyangense]QNQ90190.1 bifunctional nuclease family protein [Corynebacterium poyangense]